MALVFLLIGCALLLTHQEDSANLEPTINMALHSSRIGQSMRPVKAWQRMQPMRAFQPTQMDTFKAMPDEMEKREPAVVMDLPLDRRGLIGATLAGASLLGRPSLALIQDDEDPELLKAAKANRKARLQQEKKAERAFVETEGNVKALQAKLSPVQKGIYQLQLAGIDLEKNEVTKAASDINEGLDGLQKGITDVSNTDDAKKLAKAFIKTSTGLQVATRNNNANDAKKQFVATVEALKAWADEAEVTVLLKGI